MHRLNYCLHPWICNFNLCSQKLLVISIASLDGVGIGPGQSRSTS
jgi:hypothetical protein